MRRVVITGLGVVSCLGNNQEEVHQSLVNSKSGISYAKEYKEHNLKCHVHGKPNIKLEDHIDRKTIRFMGSGSAYNYIAMKEAIKDSGLEESEVSNFKTGIVMGSGGPSIENVILAADKTRAKTPKLMGMKVAETADGLAEAFSSARSEAKAAFGDDTVYLERYLGQPRHIEVQVIADSHGNVVHLGERECSIQRRHQKLFEEAPSPALSPEQRQEIGTIAAEATRHMGYLGVGTMEFLYENGAFFFIEMNTRLQVEHPITEEITGVDLVREQVRIAAGMPLSFTQEDITFTGHAIECRINAEHPETFMPTPGKVTAFHAAGGPGIRVDSCLYTGYSIPPFYDSLIAKLIVYGDDRDKCLARLRRALAEFIVEPIPTTLGLHERLVDAEAVKDGSYNIRWLEEKFLAGDDSGTAE